MGGLIPKTNITTSNEPTPPTSTVFIWNGTGAWLTALANWNSGAAPNAPIDSVIIETGTATFNLANTTISFLTVDPSATLDIVGGQLNTGGLIDNGAIKVDGDPPALVVTGPAVIGSGGALTVQDGSVTFTNGSLLNAGTLTANLGGWVLINESGINSGIIGAIDGGIVTIKNGTMVNSVTDGHGNITDGTVFVGDQSKLVLDNASILQGIVHVGAAGEIDTVSGTSNTINTADGPTHNTTAPSLTIDEGGSVVVNDHSSLALASPCNIENNGTIELKSIGHATILYFNQLDPILAGHGHIALDGGTDSQDIITGPTGQGFETVNLDNQGNTIEGAGAIGQNDGALSFTNDGYSVIDANLNGQTLFIETGNTFTNNALMETTNGGILDVVDDVAGKGSIKVSDGGFADFEKSVTGGTAVVQGGELKFDAASNVDVTFDNCGGHYGELILGDAEGFSGKIFSFSGQESECPSLLTSDEIDLLGVPVCDVCFSEVGDNAIITIKTDGHTITIDNFNFGNLEKASDGDGGTIIFDPPAAASTSPSVSIGGAGNDTFVLRPGGGSQTVNSFDPEHDTMELDQFANIHNVQELAAAITPDMHGNAVLELGHGDSIAIPGVSATFLQQNLQNLVHLHT